MKDMTTITLSAIGYDDLTPDLTLDVTSFESSEEFIKAITEHFGDASVGLSDQGGFGAYQMPGCPDYEETFYAALAIEEHGVPMSVWLVSEHGQYLTRDHGIEYTIGRFTDAYRGVFDSEGDWAENEFSELNPELWAQIQDTPGLGFDADDYVDHARNNGMNFEEFHGGYSISVYVFEPVD